MPAAPAQASDEDDEDDQYDSDTSQSETGFPVAQRRQKASRDIAAAKAREAAFAAQGRSQFTDSKTARPETPDFSDRNASPISTTMLDAPKRPRTQQNTSEGLDSEARRPGSSGATDTFALDDPSSRPGSSAGRKVQEALYEPDSSKSAQVNVLPCCTVETVHTGHEIQFYLAEHTAEALCLVVAAFLVVLPRQPSCRFCRLGFDQAFTCIFD